MSSSQKPLSEPEIEALAEKLRQRREDLCAQEQESEDSRAAVTLDQQSVGRLSRMDAIQQQAMAEAEQRRRKSDLARIGAAFTRIEEGEYGWCEQCGEPVGLARLEVDPMATRCIGCAR